MSGRVYQAALRLIGTRSVPAESRQRNEALARELGRLGLNTAGFRQASLTDFEHASLLHAGELDVQRAVQAVKQLRHRLPLRASQIQALAEAGIDRGLFLLAARRLGLRIERCAPGGVDGTIFDEPAACAQSAAHPSKPAQPSGRASYLRLADHLPKTQAKRMNHGPVRSGAA